MTDTPMNRQSDTGTNANQTVAAVEVAPQRPMSIVGRKE